ncbi:hypothetical protein TUM17387_21710 [Shewanella carassii]|uniref:Uncharacterized protein n=1 Tax=Shewanella carassii TaxID=1987584 RepID=A0ABQ1SU85_9GAMM|nr:hypothetical protein [Shewanella carassii]BCV66812.1 hypothetical protein TUM17387_21710 [Shewanella carassii]GGE64120.1 hypothetical protein GCM10011520_01110 [Shewanella carassii]
MNANLQQLIRDDSLCYKLAAELHYLIEHAPFRQEKLDLILLEFLACNQQKSSHLLHLMRACNYPDLIEQLSSDALFYDRLNTLVADWQQTRELLRLRLQFSELMALLEDRKPREQGFIRRAENKLSMAEKTTSCAPARSQRGQIPTPDNSRLPLVLMTGQPHAKSQA